MATQDIETPNDEQRIISRPNFRVLTTLKHILFNSLDAYEQPESDSQKLIREYNNTNRELLRLHKLRLHIAANACGWRDVGELLSPPNNNEDEVQPGNGRTTLDLERLLDEGCLKHFEVHQNDPPEPAQGFFRPLRVRILINRLSAIEVECTAMSEDQPLSTLPMTFPLSLCRALSPFPFSTLSDANTASTPPCHLQISADPTPSNIFTLHKTTHRATYNHSRACASPPLLPTTGPLERDVLLFNPSREITEASLSSVYFPRTHDDGEVSWVTPSRACGGIESVTKLLALEKGWCVEGVVRLEEVLEGEDVVLSNAVRGFFAGRIHLNRAQKGGGIN